MKLPPALSLLVVAVAPPSLAQDRPPLVRKAEFHEEEPDDPPASIAARDVPEARSAGARVTLGAFTSIQVNVDGAGLNVVGDAANEPSIAVNPTDPTNIVIGWRQFDNVSSNFREAGYGFSTDGGQTWTAGNLQDGVFRSDPVLDFDRTGDVYYMSLTSITTGDLWKSTNGGASWGVPVPTPIGDKEWIVLDRTGGLGDGIVHHIWQPSAGCCAPNTFTRSLDGGASFQAPVFVDEQPTFGTLAVDSSGDLFAVGVQGDPFIDLGTFVISKSTSAKDPGLTPTFSGQPVDLGGAMQISTGPHPAGLLGQAWVAVDTSGAATDGNVYVLASVDPPGSDPLDVRLIRSTDGGQTWTAPITVNDDSGDDWQWFGSLSVAPDGRLDVIWNDTRNSGQANFSELFYAYSYDGGDTWSTNVPVSPMFDSFLGWPNQNKLGDYYQLVSDATGADVAYAATFNGEQDVYYVRVTPDCVPEIYCTSKPNSQGCLPVVSSAGTPSASDPTPFTLTASQQLNNKNGLLFYGYGPDAQPFLGGTLCVLPPLRRTAVQSSGGNPPPDDCSGAFSFDFNAWIQSGADPFLAPGRQVNAQFWSRDPANADGTGASLSNAVGFQVCP